MLLPIAPPDLSVADIHFHFYWYGTHAPTLQAFPEFSRAGDGADQPAFVYFSQLADATSGDEVGYLKLLQCADAVCTVLGFHHVHRLNCVCDDGIRASDPTPALT
jgi:hypothetical protein